MINLFLTFITIIGLLIFLSRLYLHGIEDGRQETLNSLHHGQIIEHGDKVFSIFERHTKE